MYCVLHARARASEHNASNVHVLRAGLSEDRCFASILSILVLYTLYYTYTSACARAQTPPPCVGGGGVDTRGKSPSRNANRRRDLNIR